MKRSILIILAVIHLALGTGGMAHAHRIEHAKAASHSHDSGTHHHEPHIPGSGENFCERCVALQAPATIDLVAAPVLTIDQGIADRRVAPERFDSYRSPVILNSRGPPGVQRPIA